MEYPNQPNAPNKYISSPGLNATSVKSVPCILGFLAVGAFGASNITFVKVYDKASAPVVGTDVPVQVYPVPGNMNGAGNNILPPGGLQLNNGFAIAITGGVADSDATAIVSPQTIVVNYGTRV